MYVFNRQGWGWTLLLSAAAVGAAFTSNLFAQGYDTAYVPFLVNVNATVSATDGATARQASATANQEATLRLPIQKTLGIANGAQRQANAPAIIGGLGGKVTVNLPAQSYKNAEVLLYTVNGKRILRYNASAASAVNNISRPNLATGVYLLSVRGADGGIAASRLTHKGGGLNISVAFGGENLSGSKRLAKEAEAGDWTITVSASGYIDTVYTLRPVAGSNTLQSITLKASSGGGGSFSYGGQTYRTVVIGGQTWMAENLNYPTPSGSWCYGNSADSCAKYGRLYTWNAAKTACPAGFHLPFLQEWSDLATATGDWEVAGKKLKSKSDWDGTDDYGFSALPSGCRHHNGGFISAGNEGYWWTATAGGADGWAQYMYDHYDGVDGFLYGGVIPKPGDDGRYAFSVRCVGGVGEITTPTTPTTYTLTIERNPTSGGTTAPASSHANINGGTQVNISATPASGYSFTNWTITTGSGTLANANNASTTVTVNGNVTVRANFTQNSTPATPTTPTTYTLTVSRSPTVGGTTTPASSLANINGGTQVNISATPASGYSFTNWTITTGSGTLANANNASTTVTVNGNVTVRANFTQNSTGGNDSYDFVTIGGLKWMKKNLNIATADSWCYGDNPANCETYGRLYTWQAAKTACPTGWHLPSRQEWGDLAVFAGGTGEYGDGGLAGRKLKSVSGWSSSGYNGTDDFGFTALPAGYRHTGGPFDRAGDIGRWWTATENGSGSAYSRSMTYLLLSVYERGFDVGNGFSVRCVKDE